MKKKILIDIQKTYDSVQWIKKNILEKLHTFKVPEFFIKRYGVVMKTTSSVVSIDCYALQHWLPQVFCNL